MNWKEKQEAADRARAKRDVIGTIVTSFLMLVIACAILAGAMYYRVNVLHCPIGTNCITLVQP